MRRKLHQLVKNLTDDNIDSTFLDLQDLVFDSKDTFNGAWRLVFSFMKKHQWHNVTPRTAQSAFNIFYCKHFYGCRGFFTPDSAWHRFKQLNYNSRKYHVYLQCGRVGKYKGRDLHVFGTC